MRVTGISPVSKVNENSYMYTLYLTSNVAIESEKQKISKAMREGTRVGLISNAMKVSPAMKPTVVQIMKDNGMLSENQNFTDKFEFSFSNEQLGVLKDVDKLIKATMKDMIKKSVAKGSK